jgi:hypothetical protein
MIRYTTMCGSRAPRRSAASKKGADAILKLALSPELEGKSGLYFNGQRKARADAQAYDAVARQKLRANTIKLARLPTRERASS